MDLNKDFDLFGDEKDTPSYKGQCKCCPMHPWTEEGWVADSYGCLPSMGDALKWQRETGKIWACHNNHKKPCAGVIGYLKEHNIEFDLSKGLITEGMTKEEIYGQK